MFLLTERLSSVSAAPGAGRVGTRGGALPCEGHRARPLARGEWARTAASTPDELAVVSVHCLPAGSSLSEGVRAGISGKNLSDLKDGSTRFTRFTPMSAGP